ncbi:hypothetical protein [Streptomyces mirabilis]|uniref:hypothetical protein n=1 Tax=Streptomyces mirabilis TaxID=68239 RepID=UPI003323BCFD
MRIVKPQVKGLVCAGFGALGLVHGFAHLKNWRVLGKVRTDPKWATLNNCCSIS